MSRDRFEDLKEAYALGALSENERRELEGYLTLYPELRPEIEELSSAAGALALAPAEHEPSPEVRRVLMEMVNAEAGAEQPAEATEASGPSWFRDYLGFRTLAFAALVLVAAALLGWNILLQGEVQDLQGELQERQTFAMQGTGAASDTEAEVVELESGQAVVMAEDMPSPPEGSTMQIWVIEDGTPQPAGTFRPDSSMVAAPIEGSLEEADAVAITVEPSGGSDEPTTDPVLQTNLPA